VPCHASLDYYERVIEDSGSLEKAQCFFRFYLVPGMDHGGGPGIKQPPNRLDAVRNWREKSAGPVQACRRRIACPRRGRINSLIASAMAPFFS